MSEIKHIQNDDFLQLANLYAQMCKHLPQPMNDYAAVKVLTDDIMKQKDFKAIGYYEGNELKGFVTGYALNEKKFYFSGIYVIIKNMNLKKLIDYSFERVELDGYESWEMDCTNKSISSIMEKYGAKPVYTRYAKIIGEENG